MRWHDLKPSDTLVGDSGSVYVILAVETSDWSGKVRVTFLNIDKAVVHAEDVNNVNLDFFEVYRA